MSQRPAWIQRRDGFCGTALLTLWKMDAQLSWLLTGLIMSSGRLILLLVGCTFDIYKHFSVAFEHFHAFVTRHCPWRRYVFRLSHPSVCLVIRSDIVTVKGSNNFDKIDVESLSPTDDLVRFWRSKVTACLSIWWKRYSRRRWGVESNFCNCNCNLLPTKRPVVHYRVDTCISVEDFKC